MAAVLEKHHVVRIIDAPTEGWNKLEEIPGNRIRQGLSKQEIAPDMVVITVPFSGWSPAVFETAALVKDANKSIVVTLIGLHPSARPLECLKELTVDFVVVGEPEMTVLELANALEEAGRADLKNVKGIAFRENGKMIRTPAAVEPLIETPEFTAEDLRMLCAEANLVNPTLTRDRIIRAVRSPKRATKTLFARRKMTHQTKIAHP